MSDIRAQGVLSECLSALMDEDMSCHQGEVTDLSFLFGEASTLLADYLFPLYRKSSGRESLSLSPSLSLSLPFSVYPSLPPSR